MGPYGPSALRSQATTVTLSTMWWILMTSVWAASPTWEELVTYALDPSSVRATPLQKAAMAQVACDRGSEAACKVVEGATVAEVVAAGCKEGDAFSCQAHGWALEATKPEASAAQYRRLCDEGFATACSDVARVHRDGIGVWKSLRKARQLAEPLCAAGDARACLVIATLELQARPLRAEAIAREAVADGRDEGLALIAEVVRDEMRPVLQSEACAAGDGASCRLLAKTRRVEELAAAEQDDGEGEAEEVDGEGADEDEVVDPLAEVDVDALSSNELLYRACDLRDEEGCVVAILLSVENDEIERDEAIDRLEALCEVVSQACIERDYLFYGGDVRAFKEGSLVPLQVEYVVSVMIPYFFDCYREALDRNPRFQEEDLEVFTWLDEQGRTRGAAVTSDGDDAYRECLATSVLEREFYELPEPIQVRVPLHIDHEPAIVVHAKRYHANPQPMIDLETLAREEWAYDLDQCFLENGGSAFDRVFSLRDVRVRRDGFVEWGEVVESTGIDDVEACLQEQLGDFFLGQPYEHHMKGQMYLKFAVIFRHPRILFQHGEAMDPDLYMNRDDDIPLDDTLSDSRNVF